VSPQFSRRPSKRRLTGETLPSPVFFIPGAPQRKNRGAPAPDG
jgi:hypothetical protein